MEIKQHTNNWLDTTSYHFYLHETGCQEILISGTVENKTLSVHLEKRFTHLPPSNNAPNAQFKVVGMLEDIANELNLHHIRISNSFCEQSIDLKDRLKNAGYQRADYYSTQSAKFFNLPVGSGNLHKFTSKFYESGFALLKEFIKKFKYKNAEKLNIYNSTYHIDSSLDRLEIVLTIDVSVFTVRLQNFEGELEVIFNDRTYPLTMSNVNEILDEVFTDILKALRLRFLYSPPRKKFDERMLELQIPKSIQDQIHPQLVSKYGYVRIEQEIGSDAFCSYKRVGHLSWLQLFDSTCILDLNHKEYIFVSSNEKKVLYEVSEKFLFDLLKKKMDKDMREFKELMRRN